MMRAPPSSEEDNITQAANGDRTTLGLLLLRYYDTIASHIDGHVSRDLRNWIDIEELVQQTMLRAVKGVAQLRQHSEASFRNWLLTLADHVIQDNARQARRSHKEPPAARSSSVADLFEMLSKGETPGRVVRREELIHAVRVGIASLPDPQRNAIAIHHLEGKSLAETAVDLNRSPAAVRGLLHRARKALRSFLGDSARWLSSR
jgi:RNA polymerase sigma-70 factor (ECF subfamily)